MRWAKIEWQGAVCYGIVEGDRMIHVFNAPSPAATASISIGRYIADLAVHGKRR